MLLTTPLKTKGLLHEPPAVCSIRICLDGCESAYLGVAIEWSLAPSLDRTLRNGVSHIAHSVVSLYGNPNPNKSDMDRGILPRTKTDVAFCLSSNVVQMCNKFRESPATAYLP